jgi:hypothetical protein
VAYSLFFFSENKTPFFRDEENRPVYLFCQALFLPVQRMTLEILLQVKMLDMTRQAVLFTHKYKGD